MNTPAILEAYRTGTIAPHSSSPGGAGLFDRITSRDEVTYLAVFEIDKEKIDQSSSPFDDLPNMPQDKILDALKAGFGAAARALVSPPVDFAEAERRLMAWLKTSLPSVVSVLERKNTLPRLAELLGGATLDLTDGCDYEDDKGKDVSEETRMQRIDTFATLWLLRRAREREEAKRHATLILDAVTTATNAEVAS